MACQGLGECSIRMREPGNWYVSQAVEVREGGFLAGRYGNGLTPEAAVLDHWDKLTMLAPMEYLVISAMGPNRQAVKWNGFMWKTVHEK